MAWTVSELSCRSSTTVIDYVLLHYFLSCREYVRRSLRIASTPKVQTVHGLCAMYVQCSVCSATGEGKKKVREIVRYDVASCCKILSSGIAFCSVRILSRCRCLPTYVLYSLHICSLLLGPITGYGGFWLDFFLCSCVFLASLFSILSPLLTPVRPRYDSLRCHVLTHIYMSFCTRFLLYNSRSLACWAMKIRWDIYKWNVIMSHLNIWIRDFFWALLVQINSTTASNAGHPWILYYLIPNGRTHGASYNILRTSHHISHSHQKIKATQQPWRRCRVSVESVSSLREFRIESTESRM